MKLKGLDLQEMVQEMHLLDPKIGGQQGAKVTLLYIYTRYLGANDMADVTGREKWG